MAITNRSELEASIADWLNREDAGTIARIPDFITLAENRIFRRLRCRSNETSLNFPDISTSNFVVPVPADLVEVKTLILDDVILVPRSDQQYYSRTNNDYNNRDVTGLTRYYTRIGNEYNLWPTQDGLTSGGTLTYYNKQILPASGTTQVLSDAPGLYLFGSLMEAAPFLKFPENVPLWQGKYEQDFAELMNNTWDAEYAGATVTVSSIYGD